MSFEIKTGTFIKRVNVNIDGMELTMTAPGAGEELKLGQAKRRTEFIEKKIKAGTATEKDLDALDQYERTSIDVFTSMFSDGTKDNQAVKDWVAATPSSVLFAIVDDIQSQVKAQDESAEAES